MRQFGIIGSPLEHSYSPRFFSEYFRLHNIDAFYQAYELDSIDAYPALIKENLFAGLNVTAPFKQTIIPYLDDISDTAREIGAVNVIRFADGRTTGYNTDHLGFRESIEPYLKERHIRRAVLLGRGGASKAVHYALGMLHIDSRMTGREDIRDIDLKEYDLIVNCTPLGMYPYKDSCPLIDYDSIDRHCICYDLIYNPAQTLFLQQCARRGATCINGEQMLRLQALYAWDIWNR